MKIICAPDSFKESLTAIVAAQAMARGVIRVLPDAEVDVCPISDGGEGFTDAMVGAMIGTVEKIEVPGPLSGQVSGQVPDQVVQGVIGYIDDAENQEEWIAVLEMASAAGLALVPLGRRDPTLTSTFGFGKLLEVACQTRRVMVGIGGSATCDGGCGMAQAMGVGFYDAYGNRIVEPLNGGMLHAIRRIDASAIAGKQSEITVACDVTNPLTGTQGSAAIYGPQKGATPQQVEQLDEGLQHLARLVREQLGIDHESTPGAGAAGGLGFGMLTFLGARLVSGVELVLDAVRFDDCVCGADLVLTGEGKLDGQSLAGKACLGVAKRAKQQGVRTVALVGALGDHVERTIEAGLDGFAMIGEGISQEESMQQAEKLLETAAANVCRERF